jgi:hypothetical protein
MLYQSIPILVRSPKPLGFGGDAIAAGNVQLPFMIISFSVSSIAGIIISKFGNLYHCSRAYVYTLVVFINSLCPDLKKRINSV